MTTGLQKPVRVLPRKRAVATMLFTDPDGRVLVVKPTYKPRWELPGGAVEDGESPGAAASREVAEELGINRVPGVLLAVDYVPADAVRTEGLIVVFDGGTIDDPGMLRLPADELSGWAFVAPDQLGNYLPALQARRAAAGLRARETGRAVYLRRGAVDSGAHRRIGGVFPAQPLPVRLVGAQREFSYDATVVALSEP